MIADIIDIAGSQGLPMNYQTILQRLPKKRPIQVKNYKPLENYAPAPVTNNKRLQ
jgi:hypothetical protein